MSINKARLTAILSNNLPSDLVVALLEEYIHIKQQLVLRKYQPAELNGARFCEVVLRIIEHLDTGNYTPLGKSLATENIIKQVANNSNIKDTLRLLIPRLTRVVLDVRNKRDVAHVGGEVSPNYSDSLFVTHATDWILTEIVRHFYNCPIDEAQRIVQSINESRVPIVADVNGFLRIQNTNLDAKKKTLVFLYYKKPEWVKVEDLYKWTKYTNISRFKNTIIQSLDDDALIHHEAGRCVLLDKGIMYVEKTIDLNLVV
jgi:hypothetical protein